MYFFFKRSMLLNGDSDVRMSWHVIIQQDEEKLARLDFSFFFFSPPGTICFLVTHAFIVEMNNKLILKSHCVLLFNFSINFSLLFLN